MKLRLWFKAAFVYWKYLESNIYIQHATLRFIYLFSTYVQHLPSYCRVTAVEHLQQSVNVMCKT